jgi:hypothetical protein
MLLAAALLGLAPGCTLFDEVLPGTPFTPDQPEKKLTVVGAVNFDRSSHSSDCGTGGTVFWGIVRNTGDLDVEDVYIIVDAYNASGTLLGSFRSSVYNGTVSESGNVETASTNLEVDASGVFEICTSLDPASVARADGRPDGSVIESIETNQ